MIGIYAIFRKSDDKCVYIGQSNNVQIRINAHLKYKTHKNFNSKEYYGKIIETFDVYDKENQLNREAYWINIFNPECNIIVNRHNSDKMKKRVSETHKGEKHPFYGKPSPVKGKHWKLIDGKRVYY